MAALVGILTGIVAGFAVAGVPGAVVGATAVGITAALGCSFWAKKVDPVQRVVSTANRLIIDERIVTGY